MTKDDVIAIFKSMVYCNMHEKTRILLIPVEPLTYPEPSTTSG